MILQVRTSHFVWRFILCRDGNGWCWVMSKWAWLLSLEQLSNWLGVEHSSENQDVFVYLFTLKLVWRKGFMFLSLFCMYVSLCFFCRWSGGPKTVKCKCTCQIGWEPWSIICSSSEMALSRPTKTASGESSRVLQKRVFNRSYTPVI